MYRRNFLFRQYPGSRFTAGKPFMIEVPRPGKYKVTVTLKTEAPLERVSIRAGSGNLSFMGSIPAGTFKHAAVVNVGNIIPDGWNRVCQNRTIAVTVTADADCLSSLSVSEISCPTIYIAGAAYGIGRPEEQLPSHTPNSYIRWEQLLAAYTGQRLAVSDHSHSGLTTESFRKEGRYAAINEYSRPGDFYFFQFDPSGQSIEDWSTGGNCRRQLARYIAECRERLAYPVLLTPADSHGRKGTDTYSRQLWEQYLDACREVSKLTGTPVIELHKLNIASCDAYATAELAAREIARICGKYPEKGYRFLAECMQAGCPLTQKASL